MSHSFKKPSYVFFDWYGTLVNYSRNIHGHYDDVSFIKGALEVLYLLKNCKIPVVICSNQDQHILIHQVDSLKALFLFDGIFGVMEGVRPKPTLDLLQKAMHDMNIQTPCQDILFVGDSYEYDYKAAHAMGFGFAGVGKGFEKVHKEALVFESLHDFSIFLQNNLNN